MWEEPANIKMHPCGCISGVGMVGKGREPTKSRNMPMGACFCFSSGGEPADNKNASMWMCFCCPHEGREREPAKACGHQKHICVDTFLVSARGERLGWVSLDRRELGRCGRPLKTENMP